MYISATHMLLEQEVESIKQSLRLEKIKQAAIFDIAPKLQDISEKEESLLKDAELYVTLGIRDLEVKLIAAEVALGACRSHMLAIAGLEGQEFASRH
jgi:F420-dependent methylenetetrahydromethanopterin dehydrogenase